MATPEFKYQPMFEHGHDNTEYYLIFYASPFAQRTGCKNPY